MPEQPHDDGPPGPPCELAVQDGVATVTLNRPEIHNAFDEALIAKLTETFVALDDDRDVRIVVLAGAGRGFCAGADLNWMKRMAAFGHDENLRDATALAAMLRALYSLSKPTIARVHGAAYGGGVGVIAACDIAVAVPEATFALTEANAVQAAAYALAPLEQLLPAGSLALSAAGFLRTYGGVDFTVQRAEIAWGVKR